MGQAWTSIAFGWTGYVRIPLRCKSKELAGIRVVPNIKSAKKRVAIAERNRLRNRSWKSSVKTARNNVADSVKAGSAAQAASSLNELYSIVDKAVAKGILHRNAGARRKAKLAVRVQKLSAAAK